MKPLITVSLIATVLISGIIYSQSSHFKRTMAVNGYGTNDARISTVPLTALHTKAAEARIFSREKGYNTQICFLVDMNMASGSSRFLVYDLKKDSIRNAAPVTHGRCNEDWLEGRKYGNTVGCGCTSLGRYRIGKNYNGRFGLAYKLHGLDKTNNKAFDRFVVLHSHDCVPASATEDEICQSDGCPTVSPSFLAYLKPIIDKSSKPVLLWIYDSGN